MVLAASFMVYDMYTCARVCVFVCVSVCVCVRLTRMLRLFNEFLKQATESGFF